MLRLENVEKRYKDFALDCSMEVREGCVTGLIGANGAGKSTTFRAILGLIHTDGGKIEILGRTPDQLRPEDRERIGVVLADSEFSGYLSIKDLIPVLENLYSQFNRDRFVEKCEEFHLPINKKIKEFSTGMKLSLIHI